MLRAAYIVPEPETTAVSRAYFVIQTVRQSCLVVQKLVMARMVTLKIGYI